MSWYFSILFLVNSIGDRYIDIMMPELDFIVLNAKITARSLLVSQLDSLFNAQLIVTRH